MQELRIYFSDFFDGGNSRRFLRLVPSQITGLSGGLLGKLVAV
jgi:hypothetical protein